MAITNLNQIYSSISSGKSNKGVYQKATSNGAASAAGRFHELFTATGIPTAGSFTGTAGTAVVMNGATVGALNVGTVTVTPDTKHILAQEVFSPTATVVPARLLLLDLLLYYPALVVTGAPTTLTNGVSLTRYTSGEGVMAFVAVQSALGATQPALTFTYTDSAGNTGNVASALTSPVASAPVSTCFANNGNLFMPLTTGDLGVRSVQSYTLATGTTGTVALVLAKPIADIPIYAINTSTKISHVVDGDLLPKVEDNACLAYVMLAGGAMVASSSIQGTITTVWG